MRSGPRKKLFVLGTVGIDLKMLGWVGVDGPGKCGDRTGEKALPRRAVQGSSGTSLKFPHNLIVFEVIINLR